jgi:hypothetical protein
VFVWRENEEKRREEKSGEQMRIFHCLVGEKKGRKNRRENKWGPGVFSPAQNLFSSQIG